MSSIIKVDTIQNQSGANIISESSNTITVGASGDTITVPSGATISSSGTVSGNLANTPAFLVTDTTNQGISNVTMTKVTFATEVFDTDNCFASSTFTPTVSGKYCIYSQINFDINSSAGQIQVRIYKNGSLYHRVRQAHFYGNNQQTYFVQSVVELNGTTDYVEIYTYQDSGISRTMAGADSMVYFGGYRLIGA